MAIYRIICEDFIDEIMLEITKEIDNFHGE